MQQLLSDAAGPTQTTPLWEIFLQCLPSHIHMVLASSQDMTLDALAHPSPPSTPKSTSCTQRWVNYVTYSQPVAPSRSRSEKITHRSSSHSRVTSPNPYASETTGLCWYHRRYQRLHLAGKHPGHVLMATDATGPTPCCLFLLQTGQVVHNF